MNDQTWPRKSNRTVFIHDIPIDGAELGAASWTGILKRLWREWTDLRTLVTPNSDVVVSNASDGMLSCERSFENLAQALREYRGFYAEFAKLIRIALKNFKQTFARSEKT